MLIGDEELADRFGVIGYPTYILIGPDGTIHKQYMGELADLYKEMATQITALSVRLIIPAPIGPGPV